MPFNSDKFECLRYGRNTALHNDTHYTSNSGCVIAVKDSLMDLGVTMSNDASFRGQIKNVVDSANKMCGWYLGQLLQENPTQPHAHTLEVYDTLQTDYCSQLWCSVQTGDIQALEMVQRSFVRRISGFQHLNYWDKLQKLKLYSLERRWEPYMIIYTWRIPEKQVSNICPLEQGGIQSKHNARRGRICQVPHVKTTAPVCNPEAAHGKSQYSWTALV